MSFTVITVTGHWEDATGNALTGYVEFVLTGAMQDSTNSEIINPTLIPAELVDGAISRTLLANTDSTTLPASPDNQQYIVTERIAGSSRPPYLITVPYDAVDATVDISALAPA